MNSPQRYPSDLTDEQYASIEPLLPSRGGEGKVGRPPRYTNRQLLNGIFYALRTGCAWRYLPHDLPHWTSVYACWKRWSVDGTMDRIHDALRRLAYQTHSREDSGAARRESRTSGDGTIASETAAGHRGGSPALAGHKGGRTKGRTANRRTAEVGAPSEESAAEPAATAEPAAPARPTTRRKRGSLPRPEE